MNLNEIIDNKYEIINKDELIDTINKEKSNRIYYYDLGNKILYDLCKEHFWHNNEKEISAKIWLIGRSYAAQVERRTGYTDKSPIKFWAYLLEKFGENQSELDEKLEKIKDQKQIDDNNFKIILETHSLLTKIFHDATDNYKISLASKYLHFHCPDLFFIYDSRANERIKNFVEKKSKDKSDTYSDFFYRCFKLQKEIEKLYKILKSPREIDAILLYKEEDLK